MAGKGHKGSSEVKSQGQYFNKNLLFYYMILVLFLLEKRRQIEMRLRLFYTLFCKL